MDTVFFMKQPHKCFLISVVHMKLHHVISHSCCISHLAPLCLTAFAPLSKCYASGSNALC